MHAINFLCEDMKVKIALKFRGRENAHTEVGFEVIKKFIADIAPYGQPDFQPKLVGKAINLMISPLPRNKRAKNPHQVEGESGPDPEVEDEAPAKPAPPKAKVPATSEPQTNGLNDAFTKLEIK
jgi:translation initiation factor IF-3